MTATSAVNTPVNGAPRKTHWLRTTLCVLLACAVAGAALSAALFLSNPASTTVSASLEFFFDGAAEGLAPNGYPFTVEDIRSDAVLSGALESAGLASRYTADQIRPWLRTDGVFPDNIVSQLMNYESLLDFSASRTLTISRYYPAQYRISLASDFDPSISRADLESLLQSVLDVYKADFTRKYSMASGESAFNFTFAEFDYPQQLEVISAVIQQTSRYAEAMYQKEPSFAVSGTGFNDIAVRLNNLANTEIPRLEAMITMNGLTRNTLRLMTQYQYEIKTLSFELSRKQEEQKKLDDLIASYQKNEILYLSSADQLTKIDGNSSETYDQLVDNRKTVADRITEINTEIAKNQLLLNDLTKSGESARNQSDAPGTSVGQASETVSPTEAEAETAMDELQAEAVETATLSAEQVQSLAAEAEEATRRQTEALETAIEKLQAKGREIGAEFCSLLKAYNEQQINDMTLHASAVRYNAPSLLSGAFIVKTVKIAGVLCAIGLAICLILLIISRVREEKRFNR